MGVGQRLSDLADQSEPFFERERGSSARKKAIEPLGLGVMLVDQSRTEFRLAIIEDTLNSYMFDAFEDLELAQGGARQTVAIVGR